MRCTFGLVCCTFRLGCGILLPEFIFRFSIYTIHRIAKYERRLQGLALSTTYGLDTGLLPTQWNSQIMPQEVSVSYQAIKSKVYRLIDTLVVGDKSEVEVQESIRRWWELIHPADRPIAQKYLHLILERSCTALDAIEEGLTDATNHEATRTSDPAKAFKLVERVVKQTSKHAALSNSI